MARYATSFDNFKKIEVNGENAEPLYEYLKSQRGFAGFTGRKGWLMGLFSMIRDRKYKTNADIKWNFTKFLVNREGEVVERFEPTVKPAEIADKIAALL